MNIIGCDSDIGIDPLLEILSLLSVGFLLFTNGFIFGGLRYCNPVKVILVGFMLALPPYLRDVVVTGYHTGMRKGEILDLEWGNVNLDEGFIRLRAEQTKNKKTRLIPLNSETIEILKALKKKNPFAPVDSIVFLNRKGKRILDASYNKVWNSVCARLRIKQSTEEGDVVSHWEPDGTYVGLIPHDLRRSYVRSIDNSGVAQAVGQRITGHLDASVYENYNQKHREDLQHAVQLRETYLASGNA